MQRALFSIASVCLLITWSVTLMLGQPLSRIPALHPANVSVFDVDAGLPISCTYSGLVDRAGRLWVNPCFSQEEHQTVSVYKFDGTHSSAIEWKNFPANVRGQAVLSGFSKTGELFGFLRGTGTSYFFDPVTGNARFHTLDSADAEINYIGTTEDYGIIMHAVSRTQHLIYSISNDQVQLRFALPRLDANNERYPFGEASYTLLTESDLWFSDLKMQALNTLTEHPGDYGSVIQYNLASGETHRYTPEDLFHGLPPPPLTMELNRLIAQGHEGSVVIYLAAWKQYFTLDPIAHTSITLEPFDRMDTVRLTKDLMRIHQDVKIAKDKIGNVLFMAKYGPEYHAVLQDKNGQYYDYAPVLKAARDAARFPQSLIYNVYAQDFQKQIYLFMTSGLAAVDLKLFASIKTYLPDIGARGIAEVAQGQYIVNTDGGQPVSWLRPEMEDSLQSSELLALDCSGAFTDLARLRNRVNFVKDRQGYVWAPYEDLLIRFTEGGPCTSYALGQTADKIAFTDSGTIVFATDHQLFLFDIANNTAQPILADGSPVIINSVINQIYVAKDGRVWVAALDGLYSVDLDAGTFDRMGRSEGLPDERMMCIEEDAEGRLWIGTYGSGLFIYSPATGKVSVIDQKKGLSNNIVVGILTDDEGVHWLSTFSGLTLVSPQGEVLCRVFKEDGLSTDEFNRYSYLKGSSGELLFGSIHGVNVIQPDALKIKLLESDSVRIFLNRASYFDPRSDGLVNKINWSYSVDPIKLPAAHRSVDLEFALSNLVQNAKSNFAYKLEGQGMGFSDTWTHIGSNRDLSLQNLPPGKYRIVITGNDYRGNRVAEPLVIPIIAADFVYKQVWFIVLCASTLLGLVLFWMYQQRMIRMRLERELLERTDEIIRTRDQLVVQEKLASLGQLTAGIAHEIKNPLNFVNNFALDSAGLADRFLFELEHTENKIQPDQLNRIRHYLEEMKQNALDITSSGRTADRIVRSMMDHARGTSEKHQFLEINALIEENVHLAVSGFRARHPDFFITLKESYDPAITQVFGSPLDLARAILNVLNNACDALQEKQSRSKDFVPELWVSTSLQQNDIIIRIRDNGPGIPPDVLKDIFTPFYTTKPTGAGNTGLGLSICNDIITEHHGRIDVESEPGVFTEFILRIRGSRNTMR